MAVTYHAAQAQPTEAKTGNGQQGEHVESETEVKYLETDLIRWILPTSQDKFIKRLNVYVSRVGPIKTARGAIVFSRIARRPNGWVEIRGNWFVDGELQSIDVDMADLAVSELEEDRIEVTFAGKLLLPNYAAYRDQLTAMIDKDYPDTRVVQPAKTSADNGQQGAIAQRIGTWILPGSLNTINAAMWKYLKGKVRGWCDYDRPQEAGPGVLIYHLKQYLLGEFGEVTLSTLDEQHTEVNVDVLRLPPLTPNRDEINQQREVHLRDVIGFVMDRLTEDRTDIEKLEMSKGDGRQGASELPPDRITRIYPHTREEFTSLLRSFTREYFGVDGNRQPQFSGVRLERELGQWLIRNSQRLDLIVVEASPIKNNSSVDVVAWPMKWETTGQANAIQAAFEEMLKYLDERITPTIDAQPAEMSAAGMSDAKLDQLLAGQDELKRGQADLKFGQAAIYQRLTQAQRETVDEVLAGVRTMRMDDAQTLSEMRGMLDGLRHALIDLRAQELPQMNASLRQAIDEVTEVLKADADVNTGLELTIPLIPLLLDYKLNLDLGGGLDLRQWWENLWRKLHGNDRRAVLGGVDKIGQN